MCNYLRGVLFCVALIVSSIAYADVSEGTFQQHGGEAYGSIDESQVTVFQYKPNFPFKVIGLIEARGMAELTLLEQLDVTTYIVGSGKGEKDDIRLATAALIREAAANGANGVIIVKQGQVRVGQNATERRMVGAAIRY